MNKQLDNFILREKIKYLNIKEFLDPRKDISVITHKFYEYLFYKLGTHFSGWEFSELMFLMNLDLSQNSLRNNEIDSMLFNQIKELIEC